MPPAGASSYSGVLFVLAQIDVEQTLTNHGPMAVILLVGVYGAWKFFGVVTEKVVVPIVESHQEFIEKLSNAAEKNGDLIRHVTELQDSHGKQLTEIVTLQRETVQMIRELRADHEKRFQDLETKVFKGCDHGH